MAQLDHYQQIIESILTQHAQATPAYGEIERQTLFDRDQNHYQLVNIGWEKHRRIYGCLIHIDIKDDKIWIQYDGTEVGVANKLVELGVPKHDIVLAFHSPFMRQLTEFAVG